MPFRARKDIVNPVEIGPQRRITAHPDAFVGGRDRLSGRDFTSAIADSGSSITPGISHASSP